MASSERRYDVDWVRVIGMAAVFTFHTMMFFNTWSWHAKNGVTSTAFNPFNTILLGWIMPLFFVVSGLATRFALSRRNSGGFMKERLLRLGVPILVGAFLLSPYQIYAERITAGQFSGSFTSFLPHYFNGLYYFTPTGNFAWMGLHLWFLVVLLVFTAVTLPFFRAALRRERPTAVGRLFQATGPLGALLLTPVIVYTLEGVLFALGLDASQSFWPFGAYLGYFVIGFSLLHSEQFRTAVKRFGAYVLCVLPVTSYVIGFIAEPSGFSPAFLAWQLVKVVNCWFWIVGLLYIAGRWLNRDSATLQYANEAVMPFYILHQPVIVGLGFATRAIALPIAVKFPLLWAASLIIILAIYNLLVRPVNALRFLLGMKPRASR